MDINRDIQRWRLANQGIAEAVAKSPAEVVESLGAVQAQDYLGSLWAFGLRLPSVTETIVEQAIIERAIVRTWPMRGTLHFVRSADVRWMLDLLTPRIIARRAFTDRQFGIDSKMLARSEKLFVNALRGDKQLPREKMYELLESASISTAAQRGLHIVGRLAMEGLLCFGARNGKQQTFALLDEWAPSAKRLERNESTGSAGASLFQGAWSSYSSGFRLVVRFDDVGCEGWGRVRGSSISERNDRWGDLLATGKRIGPPE
jgi:hypothetical protein